MNIYKVSCVSKCGSYFVSYLQSVTIIANSEKEALEILNKWFKDTGNNFIRENDWNVQLLHECKIGVIDYHEDSDY